MQQILNIIDQLNLNDIKIVAPDKDVPGEIAAFSGWWEDFSVEMDTTVAAD
jgi:hypothetical protein